MDRPRAHWPPLLFRQLCLLAAVLGILSLRHPLPALTGFLLLALLDGKRSREPAALLLLCLSLSLGYGLARWSEPDLRPELPGWARQALSPSNEAQSPFYRGIAVKAAIKEVSPLPGARLRVILENVRPAPGFPGPAEPKEAGPAPKAEALPGNLVLTWQSPPPELLIGPGMTLQAVLKLREVRSFANPGTWDSEAYWRDQGIMFRAWIKGDGRSRHAPPVRLSGRISPSWNLRETLRRRVMRLAGLDTAAPAVPEIMRAAPEPSQTTEQEMGREMEQIPPQGAALIPALLFGDRSLIHRKNLDLIAKSTLAHSLALSGMHLAFAAALGYGAASLIGLFFPALLLSIPRQKLGLIIALPCAGLYLWLGGAPPSLLRAALMLAFWAWLLWRGNPKVLLDGLLWALGLMLLLHPLSLYDLRLQLSVLAVAGIALIAPLLPPLLQRFQATEDGGLCRRGGRAALRYFLPFLVISLATQLTLLPLILNAFGVTALAFPLNLLWLPVLGLAVMPLCFLGFSLSALSLLFPAACLETAAKLTFMLASLPCETMLAGLSFLDAASLLPAPAAMRPAWSASAGYWLLLALLPGLIMRPRSRKFLALACLGLALLSLPEVARFLELSRDTVRLRLLDVGHGQAALIEWRGGGRLLVDGGGFATGSFDVGKLVIAPILTQNRPPDLTWVFNSHPDTDHLGGLLYPLETFRIGAFGSASFTTKETGLTRKRDAILEQRGIPQRSFQAGDRIALAPNLHLEVLSPIPSGKTRPEGAGPRKNGEAFISSNNASLVLRLVRNGRGLALLCGDLERPGVLRLLEAGADLSAEVLVLPHHGAKSSLEPELYRRVRPDLALASCAYGNTWRFPSQAVREALAKEAIPLKSTAEHGQITVMWDQEGKRTVLFGRALARD